VDISQLFSLDADDLVNEWLAYQSKNNQCELKISHLDLFHSLVSRLNGGVYFVKYCFNRTLSCFRV